MDPQRFSQHRSGSGSSGDRRALPSLVVDLRSCSIRLLFLNSKNLTAKQNQQHTIRKLFGKTSLSGFETFPGLAISVIARP